MKDKLTNNSTIKVISLLFAMLLWMIVVNVSDPVVSRSFSGITASVINADVITNNGKTYDILEDSQEVSVVITAKRSVLSSIKLEDIVATADMKDLMEDYLIPIQIKVSGHEGEYEAAVVKPVNMKVNIESTSSKKFPVTVVTEGEPQEGFVIGTSVAKPSAITISGAESVISSISKLVAKVDVSGMAEDAVLEGKLTLYDSKEREIDPRQLSTNLNSSGIKVDIDLYSSKVVNLVFETKGSPKAGYTCSDIICEPDTIMLAGDDAKIEELNYIRIPAEELDITGADRSVEKTIDVSKYIPTNMVLVDEESANVAVTAVIGKRGTKSVSIAEGSVVIKNRPEHLRASFSSGENVELVFHGSQKALDDLTEDMIFASVDLSSYKKPGEYDVPVQVDVPKGCSLEKDVTVKVVLTEE